MTPTAVARIVGVLLAATVALAGCNGTDDPDPPDIPSPTPASTRAPSPDPPTLDEDTAADLFIAWRDLVYALPPTPQDGVDADGAGEGIVAPGSDAADWVAQELQLARERGVIVRGSVHAETLSDPIVTGERATATICSSADLHGTDVATGDRLSDDQSRTAYTPFDTVYRRSGDTWTIEGAQSNDGQDCVPPSIEDAVSASWAVYAEAWRDLERRGGGPDIGKLEDVVTDRFASTLREFAPHDPVADPAAFTGFEVTRADRTTVTGQACRSERLQTVRWVLVDGQWRIDFAGRMEQEPVPCS